MSAIILLSGLVAVLGAALAFAGARLPPRADDLIAQVDQLLPQIQCARCGYPGCRPYAQAVVAGDAEINQCAPGGDETIRRLARLLQREPLPPDEQYGLQGPLRVALIDEELCIGCARCIEACPVDAILGAPQQMHTVIADICTACELCLPPCPVDCISLPVISSRGRADG